MRPLAVALVGALTLGQEPEPPLSASMSVRELLARADGCDEEAVDAAMEEDDARSALVTLIRDCRQPEGEAAEREPGRARGGKRRGRGRTSKRMMSADARTRRSAHTVTARTAPLRARDAW